MDDAVNQHYFSNPNVVLDYARATVNVGLWKSERLLFEKFIAPEKKILELGCGAGRVAFGLARLGFKKITATDFAPPMVEMAKRIETQECAGIEFSIEDATELTFSNASFDAVIFAFNGLQMIPKQERRLRAIQEIARILRPEGIFIFTGHDRNVPARIAHWREESRRWQNRSRDTLLDDFGDLRYETTQGEMFIHSADSSEIRVALENSGFRVIFTALRSRICDEPPTVLDFSDDTRFWVAEKNSQFATGGAKTESPWPDPPES